MGRIAMFFTAVWLSGCVLIDQLATPDATPRQQTSKITIEDRNDPWEVECHNRRGRLVCRASHLAWGLPDADWDNDKGKLRISISMDRDGEWKGPYVVADMGFLDDDPAVLRVDDGTPFSLGEEELNTHAVLPLLSGKVASVVIAKVERQPDDAALVNLTGIRDAYSKLVSMAQSFGFDATRAPKATE